MSVLKVLEELNKEKSEEYKKGYQQGRIEALNALSFWVKAQTAEIISNVMAEMFVKQADEAAMQPKKKTEDYDA